MKIIIILLISIYIFLQVFIYGIYEIKTEKNKIAGISMIIISFICLVFTAIVINFY